MTLQQAYDHARAHLLAQNARAMDDRDSPVLLDAEGRRCALGCFIPPEYLNVNDEGDPVSEIIIAGRWKKFFAVPGLRKHKKIKFFHQLMCIHDLCDPANWRRELDALATDYGLTINDEVSQ